MNKTTQNIRLFYMKNDRYCYFWDDLLEVYNVYYSGKEFHCNIKLSISADISIFTNRKVCITCWDENGPFDNFEYNIPVFTFDGVLIFQEGSNDVLYSCFNEDILTKQYKMIGKLA